MKVLYLCHGRNHSKLEHSEYATTIDQRIECNPDIVIDLVEDLNMFDKIIEDNTYDLIEMRFPHYTVIINNDRLINICYKKLKVGGKLHINNLKMFILRDNYKVKYSDSIDNLKTKHIDYNLLITNYLKNISFTLFEHDNTIIKNGERLLINKIYYIFNKEEYGVSLIK